MKAKKLTKSLKLCAYCGNKATTKDHVPPKQLFPKPRPNDLETIPACFKCNNSEGKDEEYFLATFMFSEAGVSIAGKKLWKEKINRMYEKNLGLKRKIAENIKPINISILDNSSTEKRLGIELDENRIKKTVLKIVRGLHYIEYGDILSESKNLDYLFIQNEKDFKIVKKYLNQLKYGTKSWDGIFEYYHNRTENKSGSMWILHFYNFAIFWIIE